MIISHWQNFHQLILIISSKSAIIIIIINNLELFLRIINNNLLGFFLMWCSQHQGLNKTVHKHWIHYHRCLWWCQICKNLDQQALQRWEDCRAFLPDCQQMHHSVLWHYHPWQLQGSNILLASWSAEVDSWPLGGSFCHQGDKDYLLWWREPCESAEGSTGTIHACDYRTKPPTTCPRWQCHAYQLQCHSWHEQHWYYHQCRSWRKGPYW